MSNDLRFSLCSSCIGLAKKFCSYYWCFTFFPNLVTLISFSCLTTQACISITLLSNNSAQQISFLSFWKIIPFFPGIEIYQYKVDLYLLILLLCIFSLEIKWFIYFISKNLFCVFSPQNQLLYQFYYFSFLNIFY